MTTYRFVCDHGKHHAAWADLHEVRPAIWLCTRHLADHDAARDQWAAQTNRTTAIDEATQRLLGIWRIEQQRQKHGRQSW